MSARYIPQRPPTLEEVRKAIHKKVKRDLTAPLREIAIVIQRYGLTQDEFFYIADNLNQSYIIIREEQEKMKGKVS